MVRVRNSHPVSSITSHRFLTNLFLSLITYFLFFSNILLNLISTFLLLLCIVNYRVKSGQNTRNRRPGAKAASRMPNPDGYQELTIYRTSDHEFAMNVDSGCL